MSKGSCTNFEGVACAALSHAELIVRRWLPEGQKSGSEWVARNPTRADGRPGSFKVNMRSGRWGDFATGEGGGDLVSLAAYLFRLNQAEAARRVADMIGVDADG